MGTVSGANQVLNGCVFAFDMKSDNSWRGKPTTNLCYTQNPIVESSYSFNSYTSDATFNANHPGRLTINRLGGGTLSSYVNGGVNSGNWQVTHHAHWVYDEQLQKPVVKMNDVDGQWKAKSFGTGYSLNSLGWNTGTNYSISWLSWTDRIDKAANAGIYFRNTSGGRSFYAGQANSQSTAKNTEPYKWQRVYANFNVPANMDLTYGLGMYCYGHYTGRGVVKMADLQWEEGVASKYENGPSRSNTECLIDYVGGNTITVNGMSYDHQVEASTNPMTFGGNTSDYLSIPSTVLNGLTSWTIDFWLELQSGQTLWTFLQTGSGNNFLWYFRNNNTLSFENTGGSTLPWTLTYNTPVHFSATGSGGTITVYRNGESIGTMSNTTTITHPSTIGTIIGQEMDSNSGSFDATQAFKGKIHSAKFYNRVLSAAEVKQNYESQRAKHGV